MSQTATLLLRLEGPMQSWGYRSRFKNRDTGTEPTKSGVIGLLCCALGRDRSESIADLAALKMHVRVDLAGRLMTDFHTAGGGVFRGSDEYFAPTSSGSKGKNPIILEKQYLADASFVVALEGDSKLINDLAEAVQDPYWPLNLGRKSCPPTLPVYVGVSLEPAVQALPQVPLSNPRTEANPRLRYVWESSVPDDHTESRNDVPVSWENRLDRQYAARFVKSELGEPQA